MNVNDEILIGIDIGGSHISFVVCTNSSSFQVLNKLTIPLATATERSLEYVLNVISSTIIDKIYRNGYHKIKSIGIAIPGNVDPINGIARYLPNFEWEQNIPLKELLLDELCKCGIPNASRIPVHMRNDGRCAAKAEYLHGSGNNVDVFAMLTIGTGIGGCLIHKSSIFDGSSFDAGDFGHHSIYTTTPFPCVCGKTACFEAQASAQGLMRHYHHASGIHVSNAEEIMILYRNSDRHAVNAFNAYVDDLSTGLANLVTFYNPNIIALGGGLSQATELYESSSGTSANRRNYIELLVDKKTLPATRGCVLICKAECGVDSGAIGAALL